MARSIELNDLLLKRIADHLKGLQYGAVQITVHDGYIVQIERTEKHRLDVPGSNEKKRS